MSEATLKPCPFCGGEAHIWNSGYYYHGKCWKCNAGISGNGFTTAAEAIAAWNTRAERTCKNGDDHKTVWFICSVCGYTQKLSHTRSYCPNCGAKVVGE